jgi:hypothetical protein
MRSGIIVAHARFLDTKTRKATRMRGP